MQAVEISSTPTVASAPTVEDVASESLTPSALEYFLACALPCSIVCCSNRSKALAATADGAALVGLKDMQHHAGFCTNGQIEYEWIVESYSYERDKNSGGRGTNRKGRVRVREGDFKQFGVLTTVDDSLALQPITQQKRLALAIKLAKPQMEPAFAKLYKERMAAFVAASKQRGEQNFRETPAGQGLFAGKCYHDVTEKLWLRNMHDDIGDQTPYAVKHVLWDTSDGQSADRPWYANMRLLAALTPPTAMLWLYGMSQHMAYRARERARPRMWLCADQKVKPNALPALTVCVCCRCARRGMDRLQEGERL